MRRTPQPPVVKPGDLSCRSGSHRLGEHPGQSHEAGDAGATFPVLSRRVI